MKKFLTFLTLALLTVTGVWADNITSVDQAKADGYYTIVCPRSALTVSSDMTTLSSATKAGTTFNAYDPNFLFQFVKSGDNYVLYNVGAAKYFTNAGNAVDNITDANAITLYDWGNGTAQLRWDNDHALNIGGQMEIGINTWKNKDIGNQYTVAEVEPCKVVVKGASVSVTVKGTSYANGATIPVTTSFSVSDVVAPSVEGYTPVVAITGNELVVNYQPNINLTDLYVKSVGAMTTTVNEGQWYVMTQTRDGETPVYDNGYGNKLLTEISSTVTDIFTVLRPANEVSKYLIRFINTGAGSYAIQFANGDYWTNEKAPAKGVGIMPGADKFDKFIFNEATNTGDGNKTGLAINATEDGVTYGFNVDHNNNSGGATINYWSDGKQISGANNVWYIYPVEIGTKSTTTNVTYNYYFRDSRINSKTSEQEIGATVAAPPSIEETQHIFTKVEYDATAVVAEGTTIRVDVIETTPFIAAESVDKIEHWYALSIRDVNWLYNTGSAAVTGTSSYTVSDKYAWAFVGNIFDGYVIYNKEAGTDVALSADEPCTLTAAGTSVLWTIPRVGNYGDSSFGLQTSGQNPINWQSNSLKRWNGFDIGSSFQVVELYLGKQEYTVNITGAPEGTEIACNGGKYANGTTLTADLAETPVSAPAIDGYFAPVVEVNGLVVNVTYKKFPFEIADSYANIEHWYALNVHSNKTFFLYTDEGALKFNTESYDETNEYAWGFVGSNATGYTIYNKATGASVALDNNEPGGVSADGVNIGWIVSPSSDTSTDKARNGFAIYLDSNPADSKYLNFNANNGGLYHWKNNDAGSTFTPYEIEFAPAGLPVVIGSTGYATFFDEVNRTIPEGVKAYYCTQGENNYLSPVEITEIDYIPGGIGVILEGDADTYTLTEVEDRTEEDRDVLEDIYFYNVLYGSTTDISLEDAKTEWETTDIFVFSKKNDKFGFYKFVGNTLEAHKAFYPVWDDALVSGFIVDFEGTEGINAVMSATNLKAGYDIQGRRINKVQKGINILSGKKIIK